MVNEFGLTVLSPSMEASDEQHRVRQGFWLRVAREAAGKNQLGAAHHVGLSTKSAMSDYENGRTQVPQDKLRKLARWYGWPLILFTEPAPTALEDAQERMADLARAAIRLAHADLGPEQEPPRAGAAPPGEPPRRQLA